MYFGSCEYIWATLPSKVYALSNAAGLHGKAQERIDPT